MITIKSLYQTIIFVSILFSNSFIFPEDPLKVSWMNTKLEVRGKRVFAQAKILKNDMVAVFGGVVMTKQEVLELPQELMPYILQIDDNLWLSRGSNMQAIDYINHSCQPNTGFKGQIALVALRDIEIDEEITFDYAMVVSEWVGMDPIACNCGSTACRKVVSPDDWKIKTLQEKYNGYFATYLQNKIK